MAETPSNMLALGTVAPDFELLDTVSGEHYSLSSLKSDKLTVIMFICNHCPYVIHVNQTLVDIANTYSSKGVKFIAISSNDAENYPQDGPQKMAEQAKTVGYPFPYLYDETQQVAKDYQAACTPDIYLFDADMKLVYRGQIDDSRPGNQVACDGNDLKRALDLALDSKPIDFRQKPSLGCNIKWKQT